MELIEVHRHALEHGLTERDAATAWGEAFVSRPYVTASGDDAWLAVGPTANGRVAQVIAVERGGGWLVIHAMAPPQKKTLRYLQLEGGRR